ncbi:MAG: antibiotic biosynthesis monooxygenase family protein [Ramlibacter sp.]
MPDMPVSHVNSGTCAVVVELEVPANLRDKFLTSVIDNARESLSAEDGCLLFDVCVDPAVTTIVHLYEVYLDRAAFAAHLHTGHFLKFDELTRAWIANKKVRVFDRLTARDIAMTSNLT